MSESSSTQTGNFLLILTANAILGAAMPMLIILGGLAGLMLAPSPGLATLPPSVQVLAGLVAAAPFSLFMGRYGRKAGFLLGVLIAFIGALVGVAALYSASFVFLCVSHFLLGAALSGFQYFRFAAAEVVPDRWKSVAISFVLASGLVAAFGGPEVFLRTSELLAPVLFAGGYAGIAGVTLVGAVPLLFLRLPAPVGLSPKASRGGINALEVIKRPAVAAAILSAAMSTAIMVFMMAPTPLAMVGCGHSEALAGDVIRWHVVAMFAPSFVTGFIIKRFGARAVILTGFALLACASGVAASGLSAEHFYIALILLGVGWNFGFIGGTSLLADALTPEERPVIQGTNDTLIALASTVCAFASGAIVTSYGWLILALLILPVLVVGASVLVWSGRVQTRNA